ncbi:MAG TPA: hypothetical protein VFS43_19530 [Polyangiaceae bacterium]|nr:hypothetical protein [Polyangiaceae bacterium]
MASMPPNEPPADEHEVEVIDDPDLQASLDEPAPHDAHEVLTDLRAMVAAIRKAVA